MVPRRPALARHALRLLSGALRRLSKLPRHGVGPSEFREIVSRFGWVRLSPAFFSRFCAQERKRPTFEKIARFAGGLRIQDPRIHSHGSVSNTRRHVARFSMAPRRQLTLPTSRWRARQQPSSLSNPGLGRPRLPAKGAAWRFLWGHEGDVWQGPALGHGRPRAGLAHAPLQQALRWLKGQLVG